MKFNKIFYQNRLSIVEIIRNNVDQTLQDPKYKNTIQNISKRLDATQVKENIFKKIVDFNNWYTRILGLHEVKRFQDRVVLLQEKLLTTQEKRREIWFQLSDIRKKSLDIHDQLQGIKRQEDPDKYFKLMKEETELIKMEQDVERTLKEQDKMEHEIFSAFSNAVRDSYEKHRSQIEYTKYFGIVLSICGSFFAFIYTSVRKNDLKTFIEHKLDSKIEDIDLRSQTLATNIEKNQQKLYTLIDSLEAKFSLELRQNQSQRVETPWSFEDKLRSYNLMGWNPALLLGVFTLGVFVLGKLS